MIVLPLVLHTILANRTEVPRFINKDICRLSRTGLIDTGGIVEEFGDSPTIFIMRGNYLWQLNTSLTALTDRIPVATGQGVTHLESRFWDIEGLRNANMTFTLQLEHYLSYTTRTIFIALEPRPSQMLWFDDESPYPIEYIEPFNVTDLENSSVAFKPKSFGDFDVLFIAQNPVNGSVSRTFSVYNYRDPQKPVPINSSSTIPEFVRTFSASYLIRAVIEIEMNKGVMFVEQGGIGYHCYFGSVANSTGKKCNQGQMTRNTMLFGCDDLNLDKPLVIKLSNTTTETVDYNNSKVVNFIFGIFYTITIITITIIVIVVFLVLPFVEEFITVFKSASESSGRSEEL